ncbi:hypothetical protein EBZ38_02790 [bacterium]|nr:hypothetical protein [bacterium]
MSTKIQDLPTPFIETDTKTTAVQVQAQQVPQVQQIPQIQENQQVPQSTITATITPKLAPSQPQGQPKQELPPAPKGLLGRIQEEISEENLFVFAFLYLASHNFLNNYLKLNNLWTRTLVIFVAYLLAKMFVLPVIKM